jgi:hypothetical protein
LIRIHHGYQVGTSKVVARDKLLAGLEKMGAHRGVATAETKRKSRLIEALEAVQRKPRPRRIVPPPPPPRPSSSSLPPGFAITAPGELRLQFSTPEELLGRIQSLLEAAVKDFASFELSLEPPSLGVAYVQPLETPLAPESGLEPAIPTQGGLHG